MSARRGASKKAHRAPEKKAPWLERPESEPPQGLADNIQLWINSPQESGNVKKLPTEFEDLILNMDLERSIAASSVLTMTIRDPARALLRAGYFSSKGRPDLLLDGLWFRAVQYEKTQADEFSIQFEDREVVIAREYKHPFTFHAHGQPNPRASFIAALLHKAAPHCPLFCPDLLKEQARVKPSKHKPKKKKVVGPHAAAELKRARQITKSYQIEGSKADADQAKNIEAILGVCDQLNAPTTARVAIIAAAIGESTLHTHDRNSLGADGVFQLLPSTAASTKLSPYDTAATAKYWLETGYYHYGGGTALAHQGLSPGQIAWRVEGSFNSDGEGQDFYEKHRGEAEAILHEYHGGTSGTGSPESTGQRERTTHGSPQTVFKFPKSETKEGEEPEGAWECVVAYAEELKWRMFCRAGRFYLVSDEWLKKNHSITIEEGDPGVVDIKWSIDLSSKRKNPERLEVNARAHLWQCPPGETVRIGGGRQGKDIHEGIWIVSDIHRPNLSDSAVTITLERPEAPLAEAALVPKKAATTVGGAGLGSLPGGPAAAPAHTPDGGLNAGAATPVAEIDEAAIKKWEKNLYQTYPDTKGRVRWVVARILANFTTGVWNGYQNSPKKLVVTATTNGNHVSGSLHYSGEAYDLASQNGDYEFMEQVGEWIEKYLKVYLTEGIHNTTLAVKDGHHVTGSSVFAAVWAGHKNHIHIGVKENLRLPTAADLHRAGF